MGWLERSLTNAVDEYGLLKVVGAPVGAMAAAGTFGVLGGSLPLALWLVLAFWVLLLAALVGRSVRRMHAERGDLEELVNRYSNRLVEEHQVVSVTTWNEVIEISKNGDATISRSLFVKADGGPLSVNRSRLSSTRPTPERVRERVRASACVIDESGAPGVAYLTTAGWPSTTEHRLLVHLDPPAAPGTEVGIRAEWSWPQYVKHLVDGERAEEFFWRARHPVGRVTVAVRLARDCKASGRVRVTALPGCAAPSVTTGPDGSVELTATYLDLAQAQKYGFQVQIDRA